MARSLTVITNEIKTNIRTYPSLNVFKFPEEGGSSVSVFNTIISTIALSIYSFEVILDNFTATVQAIANAAVSGNAAWVRQQMLNFQYTNTISLVNFVPVYTVPNTTLCIVTQCSVKDLGNGVIQIKVASGTTPPFTPLTGPQMTALQDYYYGTGTTQGIGFAGVRASFISANPDRLYLQINCYYFGQYVAATVKANVVAAISTFLSTFQGTAFNGRIYMDKLRAALEAVPGVSRIYIQAAQGRQQTTSFVLGVTGVLDIQGFYDTVAGHCIAEDTGGFDPATVMTMTLES